MSDELKPCPFCGGQPRVKNWGFIQCSVCEAEGGLLERDSKNEDMAELWNTRPVEDALRAELEALRAKWAAVPWNEITRATWQLEERTDLRETIEAWIMAHNEQAKATE